MGQATAERKPATRRRGAARLTPAQANRRARYHARDELRGLTTVERVRHCGRTPTGTGAGVALVKGAGGAGFAGVQSCGSTWCCPQCAAQINEHRRQDLTGLMLAHRARGGGFGFLTLTMRHHAGQSLRSLWDSLATAWRKVQQHWAWRTRIRPAMLGYARVVEVTTGANGWHVHLHIVLFLHDPQVEDAWFTAAEHLIVDRWADALTSLGRSCVPEAQQFRRLTGDPSDTLADYFTKATFEVARSDLKDGKHGNRTPFQVLRDLLATGDVEDLETWWEWERASKGRRQWSWSRGLRETLAPDVPVLEDAEVVEQELDGEPVVLFDGDEWDDVAAGRHQAPLLELAEMGHGLEGSRAFVCDYLDRHGIGYRIPAGREHG